MRFKFTDPPPPREGDPTILLPLIRIAVLAAPAPLRLNVAFDCAELPDDSLKEPREFKVEDLSASATDTSPVNFMSSAVIVSTVCDSLPVTLLIREPVTTISSTSRLSPES